MRLLFKHLGRSIRQKPLQPIILILTLTLSIATAIFAFTLDDMIANDVDAAQAIKYGNANVMIRVGNSSDSRFLFVDDVKDVLGESTKAVGCYELPMILDGTSDTAIGMATELDRVSDVFDMEFLAYGKVTKGSLCDVAFISADFAEKKGLSVGDTLTVETMGYEKNYRIEGISKHPFLATYDVMVDIGSVVRAFADQSLLFAAIGEDFKPCGKIYVSLDPSLGMTKDEAVARLAADARFADKEWEDLSNIEKRNVNQDLLDVIVAMSVSLAALLSAVVAFCCLYILAKERSQENLIFSYAGARPSLLGFLQYAEVVGYWALAVPLGVLCAIPITRMLSAFVDLRYAEGSIRASNVAKSILIILAVCLLTVTCFIAFHKRAKRASAPPKASVTRRWLGWLLAILAGLLALLYLSAAKYRLAIYLVTTAVIILLIFLSTPMLLQWQRRFPVKMR